MSEEEQEDVRVSVLRAILTEADWDVTHGSGASWLTIHGTDIRIDDGQFECLVMMAELLPQHRGVWQA